MIEDEFDKIYALSFFTVETLRKLQSKNYRLLFKTERNSSKLKEIVTLC